MSDFDPIVTLALSMYVGETCPYCKIKFETIESLDGVVYNGYTDYGRIAHKSCFIEAHPEFYRIIKMGEEIHQLKAENLALREKVKIIRSEVVHKWDRVDPKWIMEELDR